MRTGTRSHNFFIGSKMKIKSIEEIQSVCEKVASEVGVKVAEVEFKQGKNPTLTIFIKKDGGVDLDTCEQFHRALDLPLDELNPTFDAPYTLNVSSLGIDWPFKTEEDFTSHIGEMVEVKLKESMRGKKFYEGILLSYTGDAITLKVDEKNTYTIYMKNIVKVNEYIDFE